MSYHGIVGREGEPGRMHFGYYRKPFGLYFSIRIKGRWFRKAVTLG